MHGDPTGAGYLSSDGGGGGGGGGSGGGGGGDGTGTGTGTDSDAVFEDTAGVWVRITNLAGHSYYRHIPTGDTQWALPAGAPVAQDWRAFRNEYGKTYLHHAPTNTTCQQIPCTNSAGDGASGTASDKERDRQSLRWWKHDMRNSPRRQRWAAGINGALTGAVQGVKSVLSKLGTYTLRKASGVKGLVSDMYDAERDVDARFQAAMREEAAAVAEQERTAELHRTAAADELRHRSHLLAQRRGPPPAAHAHAHAQRPGTEPRQQHHHYAGSGPSVPQQYQRQRYASPYDCPYEQQSSQEERQHLRYSQSPNQAGQAAVGAAAATTAWEKEAEAADPLHAVADGRLRRLSSYDSDSTPAPPVPVDRGPPTFPSPAATAAAAPDGGGGAAAQMEPLVLGWGRHDPRPALDMRSNTSPLPAGAVTPPLPSRTTQRQHQPDSGPDTAFRPFGDAGELSTGAGAGADHYHRHQQRLQQQQQQHHHHRQDLGLLYSATDTEAGGMSNAELEV